MTIVGMAAILQNIDCSGDIIYDVRNVLYITRHIFTLNIGLVEIAKII